MAQSKIKINFGQNLIVGSTISFNLKAIDTGIETPYTFTYVPTRSNPFEVTTQLPTFAFIGKRSAQNFQTAFELDFPSDFTTEINIAKFSSSVIITSLDENITFTGGLSTYEPGYSSAKITFEITREDGISLGGFSESNYFLNNEIWIDLSTVETIDRYQINVTNISNGTSTKPIVLFAFNNKVEVNIQQVFKHLFDTPNIKNANKFKITIKAILNDVVVKETLVYKNIIRGGERTEKTNISIPFNTSLTVTDKLPVWNGYPTNEFYLAPDGSIQILASISNENKDYRKESGCNGLYFKFLNQKGGISNWLFQSYQETESNMPLGAYSVGRTIADLGNESDCALQVYSKVPNEYYQLIKDLIISPDIYIWKDLRWVRVFSARNTTETDRNKKAYSVKLKFDFENRFNPSITW